MDFGEWISTVPLWSLFVLTAAICLGMVEAGAALSAYALRHQREKEPEAPLGALVGAMLGLLGFILAFTFGMTASRFDVRRQLVLEEANSIKTTYLRAALIPQAQSAEVRRWLREYVDVRLNLTPENLPESIRISEEIHGRLWSQAQTLTDESMDSELRSLFVASLNDLINLHQSRKTVGYQYRIPGEVWLSIYLLSVMSMLALGYQVGMCGRRRLLATPLLALAFSLVILMIADIDRPGEGFMRVSQQPIADVRQSMLEQSFEPARP